MKKNTPPVNPFVKIALMLCMGVFMSLSIGCASLEVGGGTGGSVSAQELYEKIKAVGEPKWEATGETKLDELGSLVVAGWAKDVSTRMAFIIDQIEGNPDYQDFVFEADKGLPANATDEQKQKARSDFLASLSPEKQKKVKATDDAIKARRDELLKELAKYAKQFPEIKERAKAVMDEGKAKFSGFSPAAIKGLNTYKKGIGSVNKSKQYVQDCQGVNQRMRDASKDIDAAANK